MEFNGTFLIATISFIIFTLLMNKILYKPINDIIEKRDRLFDDNKTKISNHIANEKECIKQHDEKLQKANQNANEIILDGKDKLKTQKNEEIKNKKNEIADKLIGAKIDLENQKNEIYKNVREDVKFLSNYIAAKILGENIDNISFDENKIDEVMRNV